MGTFNKFMMFILGIVAVAVAIALLVLGSGAVGADALSVLSSQQWSMTVIVVGIVVIVVGAVALILAFSKGGQARPVSASAGNTPYTARPTAGTKRTAASNEFITIPANYGDIKVSFETVRSLVERVSATVEELKTTGISVGKKEDNVYLTMDVAAAPDINIPEAVERLQKTVKDYIENTISLSIGDIEVNVSNIASTYRKRPDAFQS